MSETKHTPGPWEYEGVDGKYRRGRVLAADERATIVHEPPCNPRNPQAIADAQLIAAAPELYEALTSCLRDLESWVHDQLDGTRMFDEVWQTMEPYRAAIKKAQGR